MPNIINIPTPLRPFTDKKESVEVSGATVGEAARVLKRAGVERVDVLVLARKP